MKIILVRHGHPDYINDCLTPLGHEQAAKAALRLKDEGIEKIYSSPFGRAYETALHTAEVLSQNVTKLDFSKVNFDELNQFINNVNKQLEK